MCSVKCHLTWNGNDDHGVNSKLWIVYIFFYKPNVHMILNSINCKKYCRNPSLGLTTKARACKGAGQKGSMGVLSCFRKYKKVWKNEHSHSQLSSHLGVGVLMDSWIFKKQSQGSKPIGLNSLLYHWKDLGT
jgi:hypothetical protein